MSTATDNQKPLDPFQIKHCTSSSGKTVRLTFVMLQTRQQSAEMCFHCLLSDYLRNFAAASWAPFVPCAAILPSSTNADRGVHFRCRS